MPVRKLRHWKQQFDKDAKFIWRRSTFWKGKKVKIGDEIPEDLHSNKAKLRRFWESGWIELAKFEEPNVATGRVTKPEDLVTKIKDRKWGVEGLEDTFKTKKAAIEAAEGVLEKRKFKNNLPENLEELKMPALKEIAIGLNVPFKAVGQRKDELIAAIRKA